MHPHRNGPALASRGRQGRLRPRGQRSARYLSAHRRVRMMNPSGSGSSACTSVEVAWPAERRRDFDAGGPMDRAVHGGASLRVGGVPYFVELNPRAWGSLALATARGLTTRPGPQTWRSDAPSPPILDARTESALVTPGASCCTSGVRSAGPASVGTRARLAPLPRTSPPTHVGRAAGSPGVAPGDRLYNLHRGTTMAWVADVAERSLMPDQARRAHEECRWRSTSTPLVLRRPVAHEP